jgi:hypothetical protein
MAYAELRRHDPAELAELLFEACIKAMENGNCTSCCDECPIWQRVKRALGEEAVEDLWYDENGKVVGI